jgi:hypothetical protein
MSLTFFGAHSSVRLEPPKMNDARSEIDSYVGSDSKVFYVHNGDLSMQMEEVRGQVGSKKWTVVFESGEAAAIKSLTETVKSLKETVDSMKAEFNKKFDVVEDITVVPFVRNVVAQILLYLVGAQPKIPPPVSRRFDSMEESVKKRVIRCADTDESSTYARRIVTSSRHTNSMLGNALTISTAFFVSFASSTTLSG